MRYQEQTDLPAVVPRMAARLHCDHLSCVTRYQGSSCISHAGGTAESCAGGVQLMSCQACWCMPTFMLAL